ncbi:hypothetical protein BDW22DRAFT_1482384 [Trametopsis cervina]|nr:hypothetical protein BDW22DRAFT_1482384 [Trametopsis cervina]
MTDKEGEYEVESITRAQVVKKGRKKVWMYDVKWKGYGFADNTWEPITSFTDSEVVDTFWGRVKDRRDRNNMELFKVEEIVAPSGPPPKMKSKGKQKAAPPEPARRSKPQVPNDEIIEDSEGEAQITNDNQPSGSKTRKRRSPSLEIQEAPPVKRRRGRAAKDVEPVDEPASASAPLRTAKKPPTTKIPRIPALKTKPKTSEPSASKNQSAASQRSNKRGKRVPKEPTPDEGPPPDYARDSSSEVDRALVIESIDDVALEPLDMTGLFMGEDVVMREEPSTSDPVVPAPPVAEPQILRETKVPAHRAAQPRVKAIDDSFTSQSGLATKASIARREVGGLSNGNRGAPKPRSSVLTRKSGHADSSSPFTASTTLLTPGDNDSSITIRQQMPTLLLSTEKNPFEVIDVDVDSADVSNVDGTPGESQNNAVPTAREVLELAGMDSAMANTLPDYEGESDRDAEGESDHEGLTHDIGFIAATDATTEPQEPQTQQDEPSAPVTLTADQPIGDALATSDGLSAVVVMPVAEKPETVVVIPKPLINPPTALIGRGGSGSLNGSANAAWKQTTIFGPLTGSARSLPPTPIDGPNASPETPSTPTLTVVLGHSMSIPVLLKDIHPPKSSSMKPLNSFVTNVPGGPPGKFYKGENATKLVDAFGAEGSCARIALESATEDQKQNFERFGSVLKADGVFLAMVNSHLLAFSSSENVELSTKLGMSPNLIGLGANILVAEVVIENDMLYFEVMSSAEDERW